MPNDVVVQFRQRVPFPPTQSKLAIIGEFIIQQIRERHRTQGASGGQPWPQKRVKDWGHDDGRAVLTGKSGHMLDMWEFEVRVNPPMLIIRNRVPHSVVQELGTVGKGGTLPTIRPKTAKALFIPITDRAITSEHVGGARAGYLSHHYGLRKISRSLRIATRGKKITIVGHDKEFAALKPGRVYAGRLQVKDENGDWVDGTPDFIFLRKVDIPPRPQLPSSGREQADLRAVILDTCKPGLPPGLQHRVA